MFFGVFLYRMITAYRWKGVYYTLCTSVAVRVHYYKHNKPSLVYFWLNTFFRFALYLSRCSPASLAYSTYLYCYFVPVILYGTYSALSIVIRSILLCVYTFPA
jgi:hypothetical protein